MNVNDEKRLTSLAHALRVRALKMAYECGNNGSHLGGGLSAIEIFAVLYGGILRYDTKNPLDIERDRLIVSKGHCVLAYYTALKEAGFFSEDDLKSFEVNGSGLHGHASRTPEKGIEFSGGSLGMGLSYAIGVALSGKIRKLPFNVYVIIGDGECNEGIIWESLMSAAHFNLTNLTVIVDNNKLQYDGAVTDIMNMGNLKNKFESFGFKVSDIDGHNIKELFDSFSTTRNKPHAILANTIKGKGVSFMENRKEWHHSRLSLEQYNTALAELGIIN
jgi:transketolase